MFESELFDTKPFLFYGHHACAYVVQYKETITRNQHQEVQPKGYRAASQEMCSVNLFASLLVVT